MSFAFIFDLMKLSLMSYHPQFFKIPVQHRINFGRKGIKIQYPILYNRGWGITYIIRSVARSLGAGRSLPTNNIIIIQKRISYHIFD